jgi:hypothetical protein
MLTVRMERTAPVRSRLTAINTTPEARAELRAFQAAATGVVGRVLNTSEVLILAVRIATAHLTEIPAVWREMSETPATEPNGEAQ